LIETAVDPDRAIWAEQQRGAITLMDSAIFLEGRLAFRQRPGGAVDRVLKERLMDKDWLQ
jgi:hypothetical protein